MASTLTRRVGSASGSRDLSGPSPLFPQEAQFPAYPEDLPHRRLPEVLMGLAFDPERDLIVFGTLPVLRTGEQNEIDFEVRTPIRDLWPPRGAERSHFDIRM